MSKLTEALVWVAVNDEPTSLDPIEISEQLTVVLIADLWERDPMALANQIVNYRIKHG